jgi:hypothetical protein
MNHKIEKTTTYNIQNRNPTNLQNKNSIFNIHNKKKSIPAMKLPTISNFISTVPNTGFGLRGLGNKIQELI